MLRERATRSPKHVISTKRGKLQICKFVDNDDDDDDDYIDDLLKKFFI